MTTILVVDDDDDIRETLISALEEEGYAATGAVDGLDALERLRAMPALPQMILLDLMMPRMNGMEFCDEKRADPSLSPIPVVILSADSQVVERAKLCGAVSSLRKPVKLAVLYDAVARVLAG